MQDEYRWKTKEVEDEGSGRRGKWLVGDGVKEGWQTQLSVSSTTPTGSGARIFSINENTFSTSLVVGPMYYRILVRQYE
jgi:hypothetical protein